MPTREEIMTFVRQFLEQWIHTTDDAWVALYRLLLDYAYDVPRITDSNRLTGGIWRFRAEQVELELARAIQCEVQEVESHLDILMGRLYPPGTQRMNPIGIAFASAVVHLFQHFGTKGFDWKMEARIGDEVFPNLTSFRRRSVDIVAFSSNEPIAVISSKWGIRHDRVRDPQEEADTYKDQVPSLRFFVVTNEFDSARLQKVLTYPTIDGVFHTRRDLVWQAYGGKNDELVELRDLTELVNMF